MNTNEYRCVLVRRHSHQVLAFVGDGHYRLPRVHISRQMRPARELQKALKTSWELNVFVLETWQPTNGVGACAVTELLTSQMAAPFEEIRIEQLLHSEFSEQECRDAGLLLEGRTNMPFSHVGWIDEAIAWIESVTGCTFRSRSIEQWNAGGGFALFRVRSDEGRHYWFKATGKPNEHEFTVTKFLWELSPDFLPKPIAFRKEWNAWLAEDAGKPSTAGLSAAELAIAARQLAQLQILTIDQVDQILTAGGFDQRLPTLRSHIDAVIAYLIEAMIRQTSPKAAPLSRDRLLELGEILRNVCFRMEALNIPDTLIHNDLNAGNILFTGSRCAFTDWSEAAIGNPFLSCERLCQLDTNHEDDARITYRNLWSDRLGSTDIDQAFVLAVPLAIYAYLYGRGDWLEMPTTRVEFDSYARSLARHIDHAAQSRQLLDLLCQ